MDILLLTPQLPYPPYQGTSLRNYHIICGLSKSHAVSLLSFLEPDQSLEPEVIEPLLRRCVRLETVPVPPRSTAKRLVQLAASRLPDMALRLFSNQFEAMLRAILTNQRFDVVQIEGIELARYIQTIRQASPGSKIVFDDHNAETELQRRNFLTDVSNPRRLPAALYSWIQTQRLRRFERWACRSADGVTVVSEADAALLHRLCGIPYYGTGKLRPGRPIIPIPNSIDLTHYHANDSKPISFDLIFAGKMDYRPNVDAVLWFAEFVWPHIVLERPSTTWVIVGQKPHPRLAHLRELPGVTMTGWVVAVLPYWLGAEVAVMPFRIGSGTRLKMLEAMATGTPIVSTQIGAEGFPVIHGQELLLVDDAKEMAAAILDLLKNPQKRNVLSENAARFVQQYDWREVVGRFNELYEHLHGDHEKREAMSKM